MGQAKAGDQTLCVETEVAGVTKVTETQVITKTNKRLKTTDVIYFEKVWLKKNKSYYYIPCWMFIIIIIIRGSSRYIICIYLFVFILYNILFLHMYFLTTHFFLLY